MQTKRITGVLENLLASDKREWILGSEYSIVRLASCYALDNSDKQG